MTRPVNVMWFRQDLRVVDNPALAAATADGHPVLPLWIPAAAGNDHWAPTGASLRGQQCALAHLMHDLESMGTRLVVRSGEPRRVLSELAREIPLRAVYWNRRYEPAERRHDEHVRAQLRQAGIEAHVFAGNLLTDPGEIRTTSGGPYRVFTPFWNACRDRLAAALAAYDKIRKK